MADAGVYPAMKMKTLWSGARIVPALVALACDAILVAPHISAQAPAPAAATQAAAPAPAADDALVKKAKAIHERVITLDTHDDIEPSNFTAEKNYTQALPTQVNLPKMFAGGLDATFFVVYVGQGELTPAGYDQ